MKKMAPIIMAVLSSITLINASNGPSLWPNKSTRKNNNKVGLSMVQDLHIQARKEKMRKEKIQALERQNAALKAQNNALIQQRLAQEIDALGMELPSSPTTDNEYNEMRDKFIRARMEEKQQHELLVQDIERLSSLVQNELIILNDLSQDELNSLDNDTIKPEGGFFNLIFALNDNIFSAHQIERLQEAIDKVMLETKIFANTLLLNGIFTQAEYNDRLAQIRADERKVLDVLDQLSQNRSDALVQIPETAQDYEVMLFSPDTRVEEIETWMSVN